MVWPVRYGGACWGKLPFGVVRYGWHGPVSCVEVRLGTVRCGMARLGQAGMVR